MKNISQHFICLLSQRSSKQRPPRTVAVLFWAATSRWRTAGSVGLAAASDTLAALLTWRTYDSKGCFVESHVLVVATYLN